MHLVRTSSSWCLSNAQMSSNGTLHSHRFHNHKGGWKLIYYKSSLLFPPRLLDLFHLVACTSTLISLRLKPFRLFYPVSHVFDDPVHWISHAWQFLLLRWSLDLKPPADWLPLERECLEKEGQCCCDNWESDCLTKILNLEKAYVRVTTYCRKWCRHTKAKDCQ